MNKKNIKSISDLETILKNKFFDNDFSDKKDTTTYNLKINNFKFITIRLNYNHEREIRISILDELEYYNYSLVYYQNIVVIKKYYTESLITKIVNHEIINQFNSKNITDDIINAFIEFIIEEISMKKTLKKI